MSTKDEKLARALSATSRRQILTLLTEKDMRVKDLAAKTGMSVSLTSRHCTLLMDLGLIKSKVKTSYKYYSVAISQIAELLKAYDKVVRKL